MIFKFILVTLLRCISPGSFHTDPPGRGKHDLWATPYGLLKFDEPVTYEEACKRGRP